MPAVDSRVLTGSLKFADSADMLTGPVDFSCQPRAVSIQPPDPPTAGTDEPEYVLCGDALPVDPESVDRTTGWTLNITNVQDFDNAAGFQAYAFDNDNTTKFFELTLSPDSPKYAGQVTVYAVQEGGDVKTRITTDAVWPITGKPTRVAQV